MSRRPLSLGLSVPDRGYLKDWRTLVCSEYKEGTRDVDHPLPTGHQSLGSKEHPREVLSLGSYLKSVLRTRRGVTEDGRVAITVEILLGPRFRPRPDEHENIDV